MPETRPFKEAAFHAPGEAAAAHRAGGYGKHHWMWALPTRRKSYLPHRAMELMRLAQKHSLAHYIDIYLQQVVCRRQSPYTLQAKYCELHAFVCWFIERHRHGDIAAWKRRDTQAYLCVLKCKLGRAPATLNRALASLRHFACWAQARREKVFGDGLPTRDIRAHRIATPKNKILTPRQMQRLFQAADALTRREMDRRHRPRRNRAILGLFYSAGLRLKELVALRLEQYQDGHLLGVRKSLAGGAGLPLSGACCRQLDSYLATERPRDDPGGTAEPLFLGSCRGTFMSISTVKNALGLIAQEANQACDAKDTIALCPSLLRHTFAAAYRTKSGSAARTAAALGHYGVRYVSRYAR